MQPKFYQTSTSFLCSAIGITRLTKLAIVVALTLGLSTSLLFADGIGEGTTTTGQTLRIQIDEPVLGLNFVPGTPITLTGKTVIGTLNTPATLAYVVDVSGSTRSPNEQDCNGDGENSVSDDSNNDNQIGDTLDCEISGVLALNNSIQSGTVISAGVIAFGSRASVADVSPAAGIQNATLVTADLNTNATHDLEEVVRSLTRGRITLFSPSSVGTGTSFDNALLAVDQLFAGSETQQKIAFFLSDGESSVRTGDNSPLATVANNNITVNTYSVGSGATGCSEDQNLQIIADRTGGSCTEVPDPSQLSAVLPGTRPAGIDHVELSVNNGNPISATLDALGNWSAVITACENGEDRVEATVVATDGTEVTAEIKLCEPTAIDPGQEPQRFEIFLPLIRQN